MKKYIVGIRVDDTLIIEEFVEALNHMDAVQTAHHNVERKGYTFNEAIYCTEVKK